MSILKKNRIPAYGHAARKSHLYLEIASQEGYLEQKKHTSEVKKTGKKVQQI
jgi:hypothetical protein